MSRSTRRMKLLTKESETIQAKLEELPKGDFRSYFNGRGTKWYLHENRQFTYLPKKEKGLARKLTLRKYLELKAAENEKELKLLRCMEKFYGEPRESDRLLTDSRYAALLPAELKSMEARQQLWVKEEYAKNPFHQEQLVHKTAAGYYVRSKSESLIALLLHQYGIPHRYECQLNLGNRTIYPDFTIMHPRTSEVYYWEHLGLLTDPGYRQDSVKKYADYVNAGIYPGIRLILTSESNECPLDYEAVVSIIEQYFL